MLIAGDPGCSVGSRAGVYADTRAGLLRLARVSHCLWPSNGDTRGVSGAGFLDVRHRFRRALGLRRDARVSADAVKRGASDIHFECFEHDIRVRLAPEYRNDTAAILRTPLHSAGGSCVRTYVMT